MKLTVLITTLACIHAYAGSYAQEFTFSEKNVPLNRIFNLIEEQSDYHFFYKGSQINTIKVTASITRASIDEVLTLVLKDKPFTYSLVDKTVIIRPRPKSADGGPLITREIKDITVKGKVTDANGQPLPGVSIKVKGTSITTMSDNSGNYSIVVPEENNTLDFSYIGFVSQSVSVNRQTTINVQLAEDIKALSEIVVVGYGEVQRKDLTGSVASIKSEAFENVPILSIDQMLQGKAPGLQVTSISGQPGEGTSIRIRGGNSLTASNEPLYVVDGIIAGDDFNANLLNPDDVASIDILKDASSTAIYGARGSNGVILITTKRGKSGKDRLSVSSYLGLQEIPKFIEMMNGPEWAAMLNEQLVRQGQAPFYPDVNAVPSSDWQREITQTAAQKNVSLQASGGDVKTKYLLSANYAKQDGIIKNSDFKRYQFRANISRQMTPKLEGSATFNVGNSLQHANTANLGGVGYYDSALGVAPTMPVYLPDGQFAYKREYSPGNVNHPLAQLSTITNPIYRTNLLGNLTLNWKPFEGFVFKTSFGTQLDFGKNNKYTSGQLPVSRVNNTGGSASVRSNQEVMYLLENTISYNKVFVEKHKLNALAGMTFQSSKAENVSASGSRYPTDVMEYNNLNGTDQATFAIGSDLTEYAIVSYLGRLNYTYNSKYLLTLTGRVDGSSRFAENNKYAFFPAVAVAWRANDETFVKDLNIFSNLKLRASYGRSGNQAIPSYGSLSTLNQARYIFGANINTLGYIQGNYGNPHLRWETTTQYDLGIEAGILNNRLSFELDLYTKRTNDLLNNQQLPEQTGYSSIRTNIGDIRNKGIELLINSTNINTKNFKWNTSFNIARNRNKVVDLGGVDFILTQNVSFAGNVSRLTLGDPVGTFWGATYYGVRKTMDPIQGVAGLNATPMLGEALYVDKSKDGKISIDDYGVIGDSNADFFGGLSNTFNYKRFNLDFYMSFSSGNQIMNVGDAFYNTGDPFTNQLKIFVNRWSPQNPDSDLPIMARAGYVPNTRWVYDGSHLRLKSLNIGYTIPGKALKMPWLENVNLYVSGSNLFVLTKYPYYDPESNAFGRSSVVRGFDATNYPQSRVYVAGLKLNF